MTPNWKTVAGVGLALVVGSFAAGRLSAPDCAPTIELDHSRDVLAKEDTKAKGAEVQQIATQAATERQQVRTVVKVVKIPGGAETTVTTRVETHDKATAATLATARASWETERKVELQDIERDHVRQVAAARPDWAVTVIAGASAVDRERFLAGTVTRRILGPIEAGVFASTRGDVAAALAVRW